MVSIYLLYYSYSTVLTTHITTTAGMILRAVAAGAMRVASCICTAAQNGQIRFLMDRAHETLDIRHQTN